MASEFLGRPFQGPPSVPHASEEFFKVYFLGAHVCGLNNVWILDASVGLICVSKDVA
jgi:hypothetical protein